MVEVYLTILKHSFSNGLDDQLFLVELLGLVLLVVLVHEEGYDDDELTAQ